MIDDEVWMRRALELASRAGEAGDVPIGAIIVREDRVLGRGWNQVELLGDPTAHAEMLAITAAVATSGYGRLVGARIYVTVEPCLMCAGALLLARVEEVVYGAREPKFGAYGSRIDLDAVHGLNHKVQVRGGVLADVAAGLLTEFFKHVRRGGRVVEGGGLENRCGGNSTEGSNPSLSASSHPRPASDPQESP